MNGRRIAVLGLPYFATKTAESLSRAGYRAVYVPHPGKSPKKLLNVAVQVFRADLVYSIGSSAAVRSPMDLIRRLRKPMLMHWVGTDVMAARRDARRGRLSTTLQRTAMHRADAEWLVEELAPLGFEAKVRSLPVEIAIGAPAGLAETFRVLVYLPRVPQAAYDLDAVLRVMKTMRGVDFVIVGGYVPAEPLPNVEVVGYTNDMPGWYRKSTVFLRLMKHDGMAHSIIEATSFGRYALWSYPFPGATRVQTTEEAMNEITRLKALFDAGELTVNLEGALRVKESYSIDVLTSIIQGDIEGLLK